jgi:hypothetical protein
MDFYLLQSYFSNGFNHSPKGYCRHSYTIELPIIILQSTNIDL